MVQEMTQEIEKSLTDYKTYRIISLENGLKVVLISDIKPDPVSKFNDTNAYSDEENEGIQKSAVALCINVGSFNDPIELQGLAHYLEHMVFMGSTKYPSENDFDACVSQHGGSSNAWTDTERTLFYFDSHFKHFETILDKFANFFISPLLLKDSMNREVTAVNSEFEMGYSNDTQRMEYLLQIMSKSDSPYRIFQCGNTKSLKDDPTSKNIDIYKYLQEFRQKMYSSHWMTLAIQSRDTLDNLEKITRTIFSSIPSNNLPKMDTKQFAEPFETENFPKFYYVVPVKDIKSLRLTWSLPPSLPHYKSKPLHILGHLIGHEGHGSLTAYLRKMNYIVELEAGNSHGGFDSTSFNSLFTISIRLTDQGFERVQEIIRCIFSYIDILKKGIPERLFNEYKQMKYNEFLFKESDEPVEVVENLAVNLQMFESQHILSGTDIVFEYQPQLYQEMLSHLTANKINVMFLSRSFDSKCDKTTDWYDIKYAVRDFTEEEKDDWLHPKILPDLYLPNENMFIASNFELLAVKESDENPVNLTITKYTDLATYGEMWHKLDNKFRIPKAIINFFLWSPTLSDSPKNLCLTDFILYALNQQLSAVAYDASVAGLDYKIMYQESGLLIKIDGFNDKIYLLFKTIIDFLKNLTIDNSKLIVYKESLREIYRNMVIKADKLAGFIQKKVIFPNEWLATERLQYLKNLSLQDVENFHSEMFKPMRIQSYFHGNLSSEQAKECFTYCVDNLKLLQSNSITKNSVRTIPIGDNRIRLLSLNPHDVNTAIMIDYQIGNGTVKMQAFNQFLSHVLAEPCFDYLRTKETLGYSVGLFDTKKRGVLGMCIYVMSQANKFSIDHCNEKMKTFFHTMAMEVIEKLSDEDFDDFKSSYISNKLIDDIQMSNIESRNWKEIFHQELVFDRRFKHVEYIEEITKLDMMNFFRENYLNVDSQRKFIVEVDAHEKMESVLKTEQDLYDMQLTYLNSGNDNGNGNQPIDIFGLISNMPIYQPCQIDFK